MYDGCPVYDQILLHLEPVTRRQILDDAETHLPVRIYNIFRLSGIAQMAISEPAPQCPIILCLIVFVESVIMAEHTGSLQPLEYRHRWVHRPITHPLHIPVKVVKPANMKMCL